jgi:hypothetical protein
MLLSGYIHSLYLIVSLAHINGFYKFILFNAIFFSGIHFEAFRFDDYHGLANAFVMYSIYYCYRYLQGDNLLYAICLGALSSLTFLTRINQGLAVILSVGLVILICNKNIVDKFKSFIIVITSFLVLSFLLIWITGEPVLEWFYSTIFNASSAKGGHALFYTPWKLIKHCLEYIKENINRPFYWNNLFILSVFSSLFLANFNKKFLCVKVNFALSLFGLFCLMKIYSAYSSFDLILDSTPYFVIAILIISVYQLIGLVFSYSNNRKFLSTNLIIFFPFFLFVFSSLSSGGYFFGLYFDFSISLLVLLVIFPNIWGGSKFLLLSYLIALGVSGFLFRFSNPYSWHAYTTPPLFSSSLIYQNNYLGPHLISKTLYEHISPVCEIVGLHNATLLSLPFSFANYYCGIPIWNGYVQTFFDTSTAADINRLISDLNQDPPDFIFYQRQLDNLNGHENIFNSGKPLPHRALDELIMANIESGKWVISYRSSFAPPSDWMLIATNKTKK